MVKTSPFWRLLATVPFLVLFLQGPASCQEARGTSARDESTRFDYSNSHSFPRLFYPYTAPILAGPRLDNSGRLQDLIVDGKLRLTLDDAIALALENNLEIAVTRYDLPIAQTDLLRAKGAAQHVAWRDPINPPLCFPAVWVEVWAAPERWRRRRRRRPGGGIDRVGSSPCCDPSLYVSYGWSNAIHP